MSDELKPVLDMLTQMNAAIRTLVENQDKLCAQQNHNAQAITDLLTVADNHANVLRQTQQALGKVWSELGLPFDEDNPQQPPN